jgi:group I intron endonuclease
MGINGETGIIYKYTCGFSGLSYIGQTKRTLIERMKSGYNKQWLIGQVINDNGWENIEVVILEENIPMKDLDDREIFWIKDQDTKLPNGFNLTDGGKCFRGYVMTDEHRRKIGLANKGKIRSEETKCKMSLKKRGTNNYLFGTHRTDEIKRKIGDANRGEKNKMWNYEYSTEQLERIKESAIKFHGQFVREWIIINKYNKRLVTAKCPVCNNIRNIHSHNLRKKQNKIVCVNCRKNKIYE